HLEAEAACDRGREAGCGPVAGADQSVALSLRYGDLAVTLRHGELVVALARRARQGAWPVPSRSGALEVAATDTPPAARGIPAYSRTRRGALRTGLVLSSGRVSSRAALRSRSRWLPGRCRLGGRFPGRRWGW